MFESLTNCEGCQSYVGETFHHEDGTSSHFICALHPSGNSECSDCEPDKGWSLTLDQYREAHLGATANWVEEVVSLDKIADRHRFLVEAAILRGKPVPEHAMAAHLRSPIIWNWLVQLRGWEPGPFAAVVSASSFWRYMAEEI